MQGVGFRPTVVRHAHTAGVSGTVCNKGPYVEIYAQGTERSLGVFLELLKKEPPERADIIDMRVASVPSEAVPSECAPSDPTLLDSVSANTVCPGSVPSSERSGRGDGPLFRIISSAPTYGEIFIPPDIAICDDCKKELFDPHNRRYLHPFINCTQCGPRLTIIDALPYDRQRTSMKHFHMCPACRKEYYDPRSRRYDAQPVCCNDCGPEVFLLEPWQDGDPALRKEPPVQDVRWLRHKDPLHHENFMPHDEPLWNGGPEQRDTSSPRVKGHAAISYVRKVIAGGGIAAVKGIGGFHLCCDAANQDAVMRLRRLKSRPMKPFAVMMRDLSVVERECELGSEPRKVLTGHQKPIVLLDKREVPDERGGVRADGAAQESVSPCLCEAVSPQNPTVGVMLPYAPIQLLLFQYDDGIRMPDCLVMTSGNVAGAPIARTDEDALSMLRPFCDCILSNNRPILIRADDSVMDFYHGRPYMIRRSRGYAPLPVVVDIHDPSEQRGQASAPLEGAARDKTDSCILAIGGELKNTFCIAKGNLFYLSSYIGDLADLRSVAALEEAVQRMLTLLECRPRRIVCDLHPLYHASQVAQRLGLSFHVPVQPIQHHYAHILSCMAENNETGRCIGIALDGTGYGTDGTIWGGEMMLADPCCFKRVASIKPFLQTGGDASAREGWRVAVSMIYGLCGRTHSKAAAIVSCLHLCSLQEAKALFAMCDQKMNTVTSTSAGRLFDAVSAILGIRTKSTFEGEAAMALMYHAQRFVKQQAAGSVLWREAQDLVAEIDTMAMKTIPMLGQERSNFSQDRGNSSREGSDSSQDRGDSSEEERNSSQRRDHPALLQEDMFFIPTDEQLRILIRERLQQTLVGEDGSADNDSDTDVPGEQEADADHERADMLAYVFHQSLADMIVYAAACVRANCHEELSVNRCDTAKSPYVCALSGGCFQNKLLLEMTQAGLEKAGFRVLIHHMVPPNDGGIALGQALAGAYYDNRNSHATV